MIITRLLIAPKKEDQYQFRNNLDTQRLEIILLQKEIQAKRPSSIIQTNQDTNKQETITPLVNYLTLSNQGISANFIKGKVL